MRPTTTLLVLSALLATGAAATAAGATSSGDGASTVASADGGASANAIHLRRGGDRERDGEVRRAGTCTGSARTKIKVKQEDGGRLEVEFEVDQNVNGRRWGVVLRKNGKVVVRRSARTKAPSGSFTVRALLADGPGADTVSGVARSVQGGQRCTARATL
jgi:hypothetical protein